MNINTSLGEIFVGDDHPAWAGMDDTAEIEFKKNVTLYELLTMTSGLDVFVGDGLRDAADPNMIKKK